MQPCLPQKDSQPNQESRKAWLEKNRKRYEFNAQYLPPLTVIQDVPINESFSPTYLSERIPATLTKLSANTLAVQVRSLWEPLDELQDFEDFYPAMPSPSVMRSYQTDESFAEQRLSGCNPMVLKNIQALPPAFSYSLSEVQAAYGPNINLEQKLQEGHLYVADYTSLSFIQGGTYLKGKNIFRLRSPFLLGEVQVMVIAVS